MAEAVAFSPPRLSLGKDAMKLTTEHIHPGCSCTYITRIVCVDHPVVAEVHVRACAEAQREPLLRAMQALEKATGLVVVDQSEADRLVSKYSTNSIGAVLNGLEPVYVGGFNRKYFLKRDVLSACSSSAKAKCEVCGNRGCKDEGHLNAVSFSQTVELLHRGYVYFALHDPTKYLKIGFSESPGKRLQTHRVSIPGQVITLGVVPGGRALERALHDELKSWLVPGYQEWFFYSEFVKDYVGRIVSVYSDQQQMLGDVG